MSYIEAIRKRTSVRSYTGDPLAEGDRNAVLSSLSRNTGGVFGNTVRFVLIEGRVKAQGGKDEGQRLGTYGIIKKATAFIAGAVKEGEGAFEDFGYCLEGIILDATSRGLGTCWLGGSFNRGDFSEAAQNSSDELIPAVTPLGYPAEKKSLIESVVRLSAGSAKRRPWASLFFNGSIRLPLEEDEAGPYRDVLECVRLAPSASNKQPWRILRERNGGAFHFFLDEDRVYNAALGRVRLQNIDMGIAMRHFAAAAQELGLSGLFERERSLPEHPAQYRYIATWKIR